MGKTKNKKTQGVSVFSSIKTKILLLVIAAIGAAVAMCLWTAIPLVEESITEVTQNYMNDMAAIAGADIDRDISSFGADMVLEPDTLEVLIGSIKIAGMDSSYAYAVTSDGTMMYHPTPEKIGQPVENDAVKHIIGEIANGNRLETEVIEYEFKGVMKYASFYVGKNMEYVVVITADEDEVTSSVDMVMRRSIISGFITLLVCGTLCMVFASVILAPIKKITAVIGKLADLNFKEDEMQRAISKRRDETGVMGRAIEILRSELADVVGQIKSQSGDLHQASMVMKSSASEAAVSVEQVEKAVSEIAQGATSQAQETQVATENVIVMGSMIEETNDEVENLRNNAKQMNAAGEKAMKILVELNAVNKQTKEAIQVIAQQTNTTNESALKIKEATDMITDIAEETNLLSLNASIEAARAGEQGRGFAVVAAQIQKLAEQSNESAKQIAAIIDSLISDSEKTVATMEEVKVVIEQQNENVINTENAFKDVKVGIDKSMEAIGTITDKTRQLDEARVKVVDIVQNLTAIAEENAASTEETSASAAEVGSIMTNIADNATDLNYIADGLESSVKQFIIE
ncbi:MAG: methyl-accepting chemotaxis protein [Lachnospiraceae bacterium]|nr:methyl-accepting chemotaxis protein [Lachnospiraceae bacterium]